MQALAMRRPNLSPADPNPSENRTRYSNILGRLAAEENWGAITKGVGTLFGGLAYIVANNPMVTDQIERLPSLGDGATNTLLYKAATVGAGVVIAGIPWLHSYIKDKKSKKRESMANAPITIQEYKEQHREEIETTTFTTEDMSEIAHANGRELSDHAKTFMAKNNGSIEIDSRKDGNALFDTDSNVINKNGNVINGAKEKYPIMCNSTVTDVDGKERTYSYFDLTKGVDNLGSPVKKTELGYPFTFPNGNVKYFRSEQIVVNDLFYATNGLYGYAEKENSKWNWGGRRYGKSQTESESSMSKAKNIVGSVAKGTATLALAASLLFLPSDQKPNNEEVPPSPPAIVMEAGAIETGGYQDLQNQEEIGSISNVNAVPAELVANLSLNPGGKIGYLESALGNKTIYGTHIDAQGELDESKNYKTILDNYPENAVAITRENRDRIGIGQVIRILYHRSSSLIDKLITSFKELFNRNSDKSLLRLNTETESGEKVTYVYRRIAQLQIDRSNFKPVVTKTDPQTGMQRVDFDTNGNAAYIEEGGNIYSYIKYVIGSDMPDACFLFEQTCNPRNTPEYKSTFMLPDGKTTDSRYNIVFVSVLESAEDADGNKFWSADINYDALTLVNDSMIL